MNGYVTDTRLSLDDSGGTLFDFGGVDTCGWVSRLTAGKHVSGAYMAQDFTPLQIIAELRKQIPAMANVSVSGLDGFGAQEYFQLNVGEAVSTTLNDIADRTNTIFYALPSGTIIFGKKSKGGAYHKIEVGKDTVKKITAQKAIQDVYDEVVYICENDEDGQVERVSVPVMYVPKTNTVRYVRVMDEPRDVLAAVQREANDITAGYLKVNIEYAGFCDREKKVWEINKPVMLSDNTGTNVYSGNLVIESVEFSQTRNEGQTTNLTLTLPAGY